MVSGHPLPVGGLQETVTLLLNISCFVVLIMGGEGMPAKKVTRGWIIEGCSVKIEKKYIYIYIYIYILIFSRAFKTARNERILVCA